MQPGFLGWFFGYGIDLGSPLTLPGPVHAAPQRTWVAPLGPTPARPVTGINRARSVLLNLDGPSPDPTAPGEEFLPASFKAIPLPTTLQTVRRILFGSQPDRLMLNYRLREIMSLLHCSELAEYVLALDPRVTYWPLTDQSLFDATFGLQITQVAGLAAKLAVLGSPQPNHSLGQLRQNWRLEITTTDQATIARRTLPLTTTIATFTVTSGLSSAIALPGSNLTACIQPANPGWFAYMAGAAWDITSTVRPSLRLEDLLVTLDTALGDVAVADIFGSVPVEPYRTFLNLWRNHPWLAYRLGGLLLAVIYRTDALRST